MSQLRPFLAFAKHVYHERTERPVALERRIRIILDAEHDPGSAAVVHERPRSHYERGRVEEHIPAEHAEQR